MVIKFLSCYVRNIYKDCSQADLDDDVGAGKLDDLEQFRSQWQRELKDKTKEENGEKQATCENNDEEDEEDDVHRKVSVS